MAGPHAPHGGGLAGAGAGDGTDLWRGSTAARAGGGAGAAGRDAAAVFVGAGAGLRAGHPHPMAGGQVVWRAARGRSGGELRAVVWRGGAAAVADFAAIGAERDLAVRQTGRLRGNTAPPAGLGTGHLWRGYRHDGRDFAAADRPAAKRVRGVVGPGSAGCSQSSLQHGRGGGRCGHCAGRQHLPAVGQGKAAAQRPPLPAGRPAVPDGGTAGRVVSAGGPNF